ncbi:asparagine synthase-related protein [Streptomyces sp. NRRL F-5755]|uniref:asparagine synthase-related protein n=1 Tax=Streptomyces sp. NRRL F-5755 TaxID=1519475 RepID=UPI000AD90452|nr:asparagine synthase-related protein [Streptomyces sp. NRRL F-5755]
MAEEWFVVLPDSDAGLTAARALRPSASRVIEHASGRPWLIGHWPLGSVLRTDSGPVRVAVVGQCPTTADSLRRLTDKVRSVHEVGIALAGLAGAFHVIASVAGRVRVQGSLAAVHRVFQARFGDAVIAADSARVLAALTGATWDPAWLALHLTSPSMPYPLHESTPWLGVGAVPADHWLCLEPDGTAGTHRRWTAPDPELPLAEGAREVRKALARAVNARTEAGGTISSDLSGGMDSTSLTFLACRGSAQVVTYHQVGRDPHNDDTHYARLACDGLPDALHRRFTADQAGQRFAALGADLSFRDTEAPFPMEPGRSDLGIRARAMAEEKSRVHLVGLGGDELFRPGIAYLHDLVRKRPLTGLTHVRAQRLWDRLPWSAVLPALTTSKSPVKQLTTAAEVLTAPRRRTWAEDFGWLSPMRMPPWATPYAAEAARETLRHWSRKDVRPLSRWRGQHAMLVYARASGRSVGRADLLFAGHGVRLAAPFLDDEVLHAALAVRPQDQLSPFRFKPLLAAAMDGIVPDELLHRTTKGEYSAENRHDWARQRRQVMRFFEQSELARHGLIDTAEMWKALLRPHKDTSTLIQMHGTVVCEAWLQAVRDHAGVPEPRPASAARKGSAP